MSVIYLAKRSDESEEQKSYTGYVGPDDLTGQPQRLVCVGTEEAKTPQGVFTIMRLAPKEFSPEELASMPIFRQTLGWKFLLDEGWKKVSLEEATRLLGRKPRA
jgi:hypothetical protein